MKSVAIVLVVFVAFAAAQDGCPMKAIRMAGLDKCKESMKPTNETIELVMTGEGENNKDVECLSACLWREAGLVTDTKLDISKVEDFLRSAKDVDKTKAERFIKLIKECKGVAEVTNDPCTVAGAYRKCARTRKNST